MFHHFNRYYFKTQNSSKVFKKIFQLILNLKKLEILKKNKNIILFAKNISIIYKSFIYFKKL
tara:strand:+ start:19861 stop:20046 length:186 start_codon:yes stop_codon:yes gene_type:complete